MAIVSVKETHVGRDAERTTEQSGLSRSYIVITDDVRTAQTTILADPRIPRMYSWYTNGGEIHLGYVVKRHSVRQRDGALNVWDVTAHYEAKTNEGEDEPNPTLRPPEIRWGTLSEAKDLLVDVFEERYSNIIDDPFDTALQCPRPTRVLHLERNERTFNPSQRDEYLYTLNAAPIYNYDRLEGLIHDITATAVFDADFGAYWRVAYEIHFRTRDNWLPPINVSRTLPEGRYKTRTAISPWYETRLNNGFRYYRDPLTDDQIVHAQTDGFQATLPEYLDQNGGKLAQGEDPWYYIFAPYATKSWAPLALG